MALLAVDAILAASCSAGYASEHTDSLHSENLDPCGPRIAPGQRVKIPSEIGTILLDDDRIGLDAETIAYWWKSDSPDPNELYVAQLYHLDDDPTSKFYVISVDHNGPDAIARNGYTWIMSTKNARIAKLLKTFAQIGEPPVVLTKKTNGLHDICVLQSPGGSTIIYLLFHYSLNGEYQLVKCLQAEVDDIKILSIREYADCHP
jgi:hypothetical protein